MMYTNTANLMRSVIVIEVYDGAWQTNTTKSRLNAIIITLCDGTMCGVFQKNYEWFIHDHIDTIEFEHGYTFARV